MQSGQDPLELITAPKIVEKIMDDEGNERYLPIKGTIKIISSCNRAIIPNKVSESDQANAKPKTRNPGMFSIERAKLRGPISLISLDNQNIELCERYVDEAGNLQERIWEEIKIGEQSGV